MRLSHTPIFSFPVMWAFTVLVRFAGIYSHGNFPVFVGISARRYPAEGVVGGIATKAGL